MVKSGPGDLNRQEEMKIERAKKKRIKSPYTAAASVKEATNGVSVETVNAEGGGEHLLSRSRCG